MLIRYFNAEIQIVSKVNFTLLSQRSFVPSLASVTKSAVVGHFLSLREPTIGTYVQRPSIRRCYNLDISSDVNPKQKQAHCPKT